MMDLTLYLSFIITSYIIADAVGDEQILKCENSFNAHNCLWQRQGLTGIFTDLPQNDAKYYNRHTTTMTIKKFTSTDSGVYRCRLFWESTNNRYSSPFELKVIEKGTNFTLQCTIGKNAPNIVWDKVDRGNYKKVLRNKTLTLQNIQFTNAGTYRCKYRWPLWWEYGNNTVVVVQGKPDIRFVEPRYDVGIGGSVYMECIIGATRPPVTEVWWTKLYPNEVRIHTDKSRAERKSRQNHRTSFNLLKVSKTDEGEYRCYARNERGEMFAKTTVETGSPPQVNINENYYISRVGDNVTIGGKIMNAPPNSVMEWKKSSVSQNSSGRQTIGNISNPFFKIRNITLNDAGKYTLLVRNRYGENHDFTVLNVLSALITGNHYLIKKANESITLHCKVNGGERIIWRKNGEQLNLEGTVALNNQSLQLKKLNRLDKGNFTCEISFKNITAKSSILQLDVVDIPFVSTTREKVEVNRGLDIVLPCSHDSNPTPKYVNWTRNGVTIPVLSSTKYNGSTIRVPELIIHGTTESDSGTYVCSVSNSIGTGYSKPLHLLIKGPVKQTSLTGAVAGSVVAIVVVVVLIVIFIWRRRRLSYASNRKPKFGTTKRSTDKVSMNRGRGDSAIGLHFNVRPLSSAAADDGKLSTKSVVAADAEYYNVSDVTSTCIRVEDLKKYLQKRQRHEDLKNEYKSIPNVAEHPTNHAQTKDNMPKNRFKTTFPYDHTRVILKSDGGSDYINANYIDGFEKERCYIACQGPISTTVGDHWKMIWQENIDQIVMLTNVVEGIKNKCEQYWPAGGKQMVHGNLSLRLNVEKERTAYVTREITIEDKKSGKKRKVTQYHFTAWPDHGTPDPLYLVLFHRHVISDTKAGHSGPLLVHCSAGIGRTGTYIALDALLEEGRTTKFLDIFKFLKKMRYSRMNMIQTSDQYVCLHYALLEAFTMKETKIRKDKFSEVWQSILTDHRPLNHQRLNKEFKMLKATKDDHNQNQYNAAMSTTNLAKNRKKEVLPMDDKRVFLVSYGKGRSDYINAVQVPSYTKFVGYITTQLPLSDTKEDFWTMIRDHRSSTIVLIINNANEADLVYSQSGNNFTIGQFRIKISAREEVENDITKATMVFSKQDDKPRQVVLFQAICSSIPDPAVLCKLADLISTRATMSSDPITVVSSDGAENCGLFCAFTNAVSSMQIDNNADIFQLVRLLQLRRPEFFTDFEEYKRCYEALHVHLESANVYANF